MSALNSSSAFSSAAGSTMGSKSSTAAASGPLVPDYTFLSHCIYHNLNKAAHSVSESSTTSSSHGGPSLSLDVSSIVASFLWSPIPTAGANGLHGRVHFLRDHPNLPYCTGETHADTVQHDTWSAELHSRILHGWRLRAIHGWGDMYANGLGFTYGPSNDPTATYEVDAVYGLHHNPRLSHLELEAGERIVQVSIVCSVYMQAVKFETSHGREYVIGRVEHRRYWQPLLPTADKLHGRQVEALAFMFGVGGHLHNLGVWYQLVSPPATERVYGSAETLVALMARTGAGSDTAEVAMADTDAAVSDGRPQPAFHWPRAFQLGRVGGQGRTTQPQRQQQEEEEEFDSDDSEH